MSGLVESAVHRELGYIAMKDGTHLAYMLWRLTECRPYPTVITYSAYAESGMPFDRAKRFLEAGYAYLGVNVRGTGASEGTFSYFQPIEAEDGAAMIEWAAAQSWSNGNLGMVGASYGAHTQIAVAALSPPHLKAIVPISVDGCEYRDEAVPGGIPNIAMLASWTYVQQPELASSGIEARVAAGDTHSAAIRAAQAPNRACKEALEHPLYDEWWRARSLQTLVERVKVPTLIIQAWQDEWIRPNGALRLFQSLHGVPRRLVLQNGPHRLTPYLINQAEQMRWLGRWVKGERNGVESELPVTVHWEVTEHDMAAPSADSVHATPGWTTSYSNWPAPDTKWWTLHLTASGELRHAAGEDDSPEGGSDGLRSYVYPLGTELVGNGEQFELPPAPRGALSYRTPPMEFDTAILGAPQLHLFFSGDQTDTDFMFTLKDIDPLGNTLFLQRSVLRASMRSLDTEASSHDELVQSFTESAAMVPGEIHAASLSLAAVGHVVRSGHRLELSILAPCTIPSPVWGFMPTSAPAVIKIHHHPPHISTLQLPILQGERGRRPAPRLGALRNQPFRPAPQKASGFGSTLESISFVGA